MTPALPALDALLAAATADAASGPSDPPRIAPRLAAMLRVAVEALTTVKDAVLRDSEAKRDALSHRIDLHFSLPYTVAFALDRIERIAKGEA